MKVRNASLEFNPSRGPVKRLRLRKSNYLKTFPMHMMTREIIPGRKGGFDSVLYKMWPLLASWLAASRCQPRWRRPKLIDLAGSA